MIEIREITGDDAEALVKLMLQLDRETKYLLYEPGERPADVREWEKKLTSMKPPENGTVFAAEGIGHDGEMRMAGYLEVRRMPWQKVRHRVYIVIGILQQFAGRGVGTRLMSELETWCRKHGINRICLTVIEENKAAVALYKKMGYRIEGHHPKSMRIDGRYVDELTMGKDLEGFST